MENCGLTFHEPTKLLICLDCQYCVALKSLDRHLSDRHRITAENRASAIAEATSLQVEDPVSFQPLPDCPPIPHIPTQKGFICNVPRCDALTISKNRKNLTRHLSKAHNIANCKGKTPPKDTDIKVVHVQSVQSSARYHPFVVVPEIADTTDNCSGSDSSSDDGPNRQLLDEATKKQIAEEYNASQQEWLSSHNQLPVIPELYVSQTPPWLQRTGISSWITSLAMDKSDICTMAEAIPGM